MSKDNLRTDGGEIVKQALNLAGPPGTLFDAFDPRTLRVDADTRVTYMSFFSGREFGSGIRDVRVRFEGIDYATQVPEPGVLAFLAVGLAGLAGLITRSRRRDPGGASI